MIALLGSLGGSAATPRAWALGAVSVLERRDQRLSRRAVIGTDAIYSTFAMQNLLF